jgi:hypothetical protein
MSDFDGITIPLKVIPKPQEGTRTVVLNQTPDGVLFRGTDDCPDICCGSCGAVLGHGVSRQAFTNLVISCPCGAFNEA